MSNVIFTMCIIEFYKSMTFPIIVRHNSDENKNRHEMATYLHGLKKTLKHMSV